MDVLDYLDDVKNGNIDLKEHMHKVHDELRSINKEYHYFNALSDTEWPDENKADGRLKGLPVSIKDCICVKGMESTAGSRMLEGYKPLFDATPVHRLKRQGAIIVGKTSQDEFGFGSFSTNMGKGFKAPLNPFDKHRVCGGSSGGSAGITQKASFPHISIAESTGGSIVAPASFCGVFGMCPTYGLVSRYGLIDYANSLDKIGPMAKKCEEIALALEIIAGHDKKDSTSLEIPEQEYFPYLEMATKGLKIGIIQELFNDVDENVKNKVNKAIEKLESLGAECNNVKLPLTTKYGIPTYYLIAAAEASTNLAKYSGLRYGKHEPLEGNFNHYFTKVRHNFGTEAKRRIILGTFVRMAGYRDAYYLKALQVRSKITEEYKKLFKTHHVLLSPTMPVVPPKFTEIEKLTPLQNYMMDVMTVGPNLSGMPHMNVPVGFANELPVGMLLIADHLKEGELLRAGKNFGEGIR